MAWRNVWRNPKRTGIILVAVIIGAWSMLAFCALSRGMIDSTLENALNSLTGQIQIQHPAFREDPAVENRIKDPGAVAGVLDRSLPQGALWAFRIQVDGVASNAKESKGVTIVGIDPEKEPELSFYGDNTPKGTLLVPGDDHAILVGQALLDTFETKIGRKLVLMTRGADNDTASKAFKIKGTFKADTQATEKQYVFITITAAQKFLGIGGDVSFGLHLPAGQNQPGPCPAGQDCRPPGKGVAKRPCRSDLDGPASSAQRVSFHV